MTAPSLTALAARLAAAEARLADIEGGYGRAMYRLERLTDIEGGYGRTMYRLERDSVRTQLWLARIAQRLGGIETPTEDEVDAVLDEN